MDIEGYCVKCKAKRTIQKPTAGFNKRGSAVVYGTCPVCGTKIYRIGRTELHKGMEAPKKQSFLKKKMKLPCVSYGSHYLKWKFQPKYGYFGTRILSL